MNSQIFREYDIRGIVGKDLDEEVFRTIGKAYGTYLLQLGPRSSVVAHDNRLSSQAFSDALVEGMLSAGVDVIDIGEAPTPVMYFTIARLNQEAGVVVTASHNPVQYNGCKLRTADEILYGSHIRKIRALAESGRFATGSGRYSQMDVISQYIEEVAGLVELKRRLRVVVDAGNGTTSSVVPALLSRAGADVIKLYCESDGSFPHHLPDPTVAAYMADLSESVRENHADLGIGMDGDGDRIGAVDEQGNMVYGDRLLALYARKVLSTKASPVVFDIKCSQALKEEIERLGGRPVIWKTGYPLIKSKMDEVGALVGGEMSGHMYFADTYYGYDDGMYAALRLLEAAAEFEGSFGTLMSTVPQYPSTPELRLACTDKDKFRIVEEIKELFSSGYEIIDVDGVRVQFEDGWALVRASNTQPILVARFEARTEARLREIKLQFKEILSRFPEVEELP